MRFSSRERGMVAEYFQAAIGRDASVSFGSEYRRASQLSATSVELGCLFYRR